MRGFTGRCAEESGASDWLMAVTRLDIRKGRPTGQSPNLTPAAKSLIRRHKKGSLRWCEKGSGRQITDRRGRNVAALEKRQTSITPAPGAELMARYEAGATIRQLAAWSGAHRQTIVRHLVRAGVELRRGGLTDQQSELVRQLHQTGSRWWRSGPG